MEERRTATDVRRNIDRFADEGAWGFGTLLAVIAACFVVLGVIIYVFGEDQSTQTASTTMQPRSEQTIKTTPSPGDPSTIGQGGQGRQ